jgi:hypothetical protein
VRNGIEVVLQIRIDYLGTPLLADMEERTAHGHLGVQARPETILLREQVGLEDGLKHQQGGRLHHPVAHRRNPERAQLAVRLWNPHPPEGLGRVRLRLQLRPEVRQPPSLAPSLDALEVLPVDSRRPTVATALAPRLFEDVLSVHLVPQAVETVARFRLRFRVQ